MGTPPDDPGPVAPGPYRAPRLSPPAAPRPRWPVALAVAALAALAAAALAPRRRPPPRPAVPGDAGTFDAPVLHASRLVGHTFPCALTRVRGGRAQVVCGAARAVTARGETRGAPRAWYTGELTALLPASDRRGGEVDSFDARWSPDHYADVIATGRRPDGTWVSFHNGEAAAKPVELPSLGSRGALVELRYAAAVVQWGWCGNARGPASAWVGRAADGSLVALPLEREGAPLVWRSVLGREADVRVVALDGLSYCAISRGREVLCGWIPKSSDQEPDAPRRAELLAQPRLDEVALRDGIVCARGAAGVRCAQWTPDHPRAVEVRAPGFEGDVAAMALGERDLCLADARGRWWCEGGPGRDDPPPARNGYDPAGVRPFALAHAPALDGAREVAFAGGGGCARWPAGDVRCWGRATRGGHVWARAGATEVPALRGAVALDVAEEGVCAAVGGALRCAGTPSATIRGAAHPAAVPFDIPLPWPPRAVSLDRGTVCAAGHGLWCGRAEPLDGPTSPGLFPFATGGAPPSIRASGGVTCATTATGEAWCETYNDRDPGFRRAPALDRGDALVAHDDGLCAVRAGRVVGCFPENPWANYPPPGSPYDPAARYDAAAPPELGAIVEGDGLSACVRGATGRVACPATDYAHNRTTLELVPGVERARLARGTGHFGCALTEGGSVRCWGSNASGLLTAAEVARTPRLVPLAR